MMIMKIFDILSNHYHDPKVSYFVNFVISNIAPDHSGYYDDILMVPYKKRFAASSNIGKYNLGINGSNYDKKWNTLHYL